MALAVYNYVVPMVLETYIESVRSHLEQVVDFRVIPRSVTINTMLVRAVASVRIYSKLTSDPGGI